MNGFPRIPAEASDEFVNAAFETYLVYGTDDRGRICTVAKKRTKAEGDAHRAQVAAERQRRCDEQARHARNVQRETSQRCLSRLALNGHGEEPNEYVDAPRVDDPDGDEIR